MNCPILTMGEALGRGEGGLKASAMDTVCLASEQNFLEFIKSSTPSSRHKKGESRDQSHLYHLAHYNNNT